MNLFVGLNFSVFLLKMDATALHYENQKLVQQLEAQKSEMHVLEAKFKELRNEQSSYDNTLISLDKMWNQVLSSESHFMVLFWFVMLLTNIC